ncbi:MAG TPA: HAD family hydrolase [Candidatus Caccomorpha excrementavium]|nr:HAD family hydrolase [Candidatus Caccomorpha excrementavium]
MIKLIATDLDGTLLQNGSQSLSEYTLELIRRVQESGILMTAASGRQYPNLCRLFSDASARMAFICENGSLVRYQGEDILKEPLPAPLCGELIEDIMNREGCEVLISGADTSYLMPKSASYVDRMQNIVKNHITIIQSPAEIKEDIIKISAYEDAGILEHSASYFVGRWKDRAACTVSGYGWLDFVGKGVNKGRALTALMDRLHILPDEAMAFGDNYNDLEMLSTVKYGFVMDNAPEEILAAYSLHTPSVEQVLRSLLNGQFPES